MEKKIIIIGAGYAGVLTAKKLAKKFRKDPQVSITIIDKNSYHTMLTELHEVAANRVEEDSIIMNLEKIFAGRKVNVVRDLVTEVDFKQKKVVGKKESYHYDYLVLAAGSKPTYYGVEGAEQHAFKLWSYEDAIRLKDQIHDCFRKAVATTDLEEKKKLLTFYVVGAGFTGSEMAGELAEYVPILCDMFHIERELVTICVADILERVVPTLPEKLSAKVEKRLKKMGVRVMLKTDVVTIGPDFIETKFNETVTKEAAATIIWAAGIESADITEKAASQLQSANRGRIKVDPYLRSLDDESVYIAGDNMFYIPEGEERPVPQVVENCEHSADTVTRNLVTAITGEGEMQAYKPAFHGIMVSIGGRYGVARVGTPKSMWNLPSFFAMFVKHFINIVYFIQVLGWNKVFSYLKHEFFTIRHRRSFVGGHFSNVTPSFLLVPLRVWLGAVWVFEGVMKIVEGWLKTPKLEGFFGGANAWYNSILSIKNTVSNAAGAAAATAAPAADAVSAATGVGDSAAGAAVQAGSVLINWDFLGLFQMYLVSGKQLAQSTLGDIAFKLNIPMMNWFIDKLIIPYNGVQLGMQIFIVLAEILIGLALIGGLFTAPASAFSLILQFMFVTTTGLYFGTFWMIFAAIAVLIGAGRTIGLDYYAMPYLKGKWKQLPFIRKWYLYHD